MMDWKMARASGIAAAILLGITLGGVSEAHGQGLTLRISTEAGPGTSSVVMLETFKETLEAELGDDVQVDLFTTGQLGDEIVHMEQVRTGQIDITPILADAVQLDPKWAMFDAPFLFSSFDQVHAVLDGPIGEEMSESMRDRAGLQVLGLGGAGFRHITNNVRPIVTPDDLAGIKLRVPGSQSRIRAFEHLGATPVTMNMGELYLALQQGTMDGQENPLQTIIARSLQEVQAYLSLSSHVYSPVTLAMNGARWDALSEEYQEAILRAARVSVERSRENAERAGEEGLAVLEPHMEINEIDLAAFQEAARPVWDELATVAGEDFAARLIDAVAD
jgi:TRAP-type transport system periplasmic protein